MNLEEAKQLIGTTVNVHDNPETDSFSGNVLDVQENEIDGILVSVADGDNDSFDIELEYVSSAEEPYIC